MLDMDNVKLYSISKLNSSRSKGSYSGENNISIHEDGRVIIDGNHYKMIDWDGYVLKLGIKAGEVKAKVLIDEPAASVISKIWLNVKP